MAVVHISTRPLWTQYIRGIGVPGIKAHAVNQIFPPAEFDGRYRTVCGTEPHHHDLHLEPPDDLQAACKSCHRAMRARFGADARWFRVTVVSVEPAAEGLPTYDQARLDNTLGNQITLAFDGFPAGGAGIPHRT